ncbi:anhydro-N-acetylmuramic acid kinase [Acetobacter sicerae]|uniref:Anhydro-N-acetylmuramic acid kinase n=1 Tax=Acetobacter sicerae TaxID=85325 RepID=A0ABS8VRL0_9PROT|nr:anhydro-N-acetylmuramic acid kinase [Acetobacter sicerae]MCE0743175.1 anhydro-N-acetylmuramic acid kinase [Acetobacter sicerae]
MSRPLNVIGLMSGTSLDGVDAAVIRTDGVTVFEHGPSLSLPYDTDLRLCARTLLDRAAHLAPDAPEVLDVERRLTERHVEAVEALRIQTDPVDLIGFHGQTIYHAPALRRTWQIGDATLLSRETQLPVVHDFRSADVAAGGEGAPLAPWYHAALLQNAPRPVAILNIGGVANVTFLGRNSEIIACDTGPGNALMDDWALRHTGVACDMDGALARKGQIDQAILDTLLTDPYFSRPAPKSLDRQSFIAALDAVSGCSPADGAATLAAFTIAAIARTRFPEEPAVWYVCGGGRHNPALMEGLQKALNAPVRSGDSLGWNGDALEAECFGFLAVRVLRQLPLSAPGITGAPGFLSGGRLTCAGLTTLPRWISLPDEDS